MTPEALTAALEQGLHQPRTEPAPTAHPLSEVIGCSDHDARVMADAKGLIDEQNLLHCWGCTRVCDWHVSLHCEGCRAAEKRDRPERQRREREAQRSQRQREQEQSRPQQRAPVRSFRDGY
jgi:hypothetical protein